MTYKEFEVLARDALGELPKEFKDKLQNVDIIIEAFGALSWRSPERQNSLLWHGDAR